MREIFASRIRIDYLISFGREREREREKGRERDIWTKQKGDRQTKIVCQKCVWKKMKVMKSKKEKLMRKQRPIYEKENDFKYYLHMQYAKEAFLDTGTSTSTNFESNVGQCMV